MRATRSRELDGVHCWSEGALVIAVDSRCRVVAVATYLDGSLNVAGQGSSSDMRRLRKADR